MIILKLYLNILLTMGIVISITAGVDTSTSFANASGSVQHIITDEERSTFGITDASLKNAVGKSFGKNPNDAYVKSPTPWNDLYKTYHWPEVQLMLVVQGAIITGITSEPVIIATKTFVNDSSKKGTFGGKIMEQVNNTSTENWSGTDKISVGQKIKYGIKFLGTGVEGETHLDYEHSWMQGGSESTSITVGSESEVTVPLDPGQSVEALLSASKGVMKVRIAYNTYLTGRIAVNYDPTYKSHHFFALDIGTVMRAAGLSNSKQFTEDIEIGYYSNSKIELRDLKGQLKTVFSSSELPGVMQT